MIDDALTQSIIECAVEVHKELGPGLLESTYRVCLCYEFRQRQIPFVVEASMVLNYKELTIPNAYRPDLIVASEVMIELKHVENILTVHEAQPAHLPEAVGIKERATVELQRDCTEKRNSEVVFLPRLPRSLFSPPLVVPAVRR